MGKSSLYRKIWLFFISIFLLSFPIKTQGSQVPFELAEKVAFSFSRDIFENAVFGPSERYYGLDNKPAVYVFALNLKGESFPNEHEILNKVAEGRKVFDRGRELHDEELTKAGKRMMVGEDEYGMIMVSARYEMGPIIEYYKGLPLHYTAREKAKGVAEKELGTKEIRLNRVIFYTPFDIWFEFVSSEEVIYVSPFTFQAFRKEEIFSVPPLEISKEESEKAEQEWLRIERGEKLYPTLDQFRISGVPDFDWSYGCSPTASADVLGYWDARGYPLLIDYYFWRWDALEGEWDYVPNVQQQLAIAMNTDTTTGGTYLTNIVTGTQAVCSDPYWENNYNFIVENVDDNLSRLLCELKLLHPTHWCLDGHPTYGWHSVCAMGWGPPDTTWICIHDTWSSTPTEVVIEYDWGGGGCHVIPIVPPSSFTEFDRFSPDGTVTMAWGDYDDDGYQDIAVSSVDPYSGIYRNNHNGTFTKTITLSGVGFAWGDYDNDGDLDLAASKCYELGNKLFINNGDGTFTETEQFGSCWSGYDIEWAGLR